MFSLLLSIALMGSPSADAIAVDSLQQYTDSIPTDTMREVTVRAGRKLPTVSFPLQGGPGMMNISAPPSLGQILEKLSPGLNDKITHPFAIKQRKKERRQKRAMKALEDFEKNKTFDELVREAYEKQLLEEGNSLAPDPAR